MTTETTTETIRYRVTLDRPSRSKSANAWAKIKGEDGWLPDSFTADHGTVIVLGGDIRRATRIEKVRETITIDEIGSWSAWGGAGGITIS